MPRVDDAVFEGAPAEHLLLERCLGSGEAIAAAFVALVAVLCVLGGLVVWQRQNVSDVPVVDLGVDDVPAPKGVDEIQQRRYLRDGWKEDTSASLTSFLDATTLMEYLIKRGMPQRAAHHLIGQVVRLATEKRVTLSELTLKEFQEFDSTLDESVFEVLGTTAAVAAFQSVGSTGPEQVAAQVEYWRKQLS